ncbi:DNA primase [Burkholderiaceae bacterium DAT-1]|nr:DNA primase [Burkholderiaceae bacterium DAT-1]
MARLPEDFVQDLLHRVDIVEVVERYLPLKKAGMNYAACCPFHKEKSPSFTVSPTKQFYHCFGCGAHGSAIGFVMEYEGIGFQDAALKLAEQVGMQAPKMETSPDAPRQHARHASLVDLNREAMQFYRNSLKASPRAIDYLKRRGLSGQIAARFGLGFAPEGWHPLAQVFSDYATQPALAEVGLVIDSEDSGRRYDRFRDRIMFPIIDGKGVVIGFGGRVIDKGDPKYLNTPETPLFHKGYELYGLPQARQAIREKGRVMVVEGYMDVVALAQLGVEYSVASLGTACTPDHIKKLLRLADEVVFCFDGDAAGRRAAWRALENSLGQVNDGKQLNFLFLPAEHDPDSYIRAFGKDAFESFMAEQSVGLVAFLTRELASQYDLGGDAGRAQFLHASKPLVEQVKAPATRLLLRNRIAEMAGLAGEDAGELLGVRAPARSKESSRSREYESGGGKFKGKKKRDGDRPQWVERRPRTSTDLGRELLQLLMFDPNYAWQMPEMDVPAELMTSNIDALWQVVDRVHQLGRAPLGSHLLESFRDDDVYSLLEQALSTGDEHYSKSDAKDVAKAFADGLQRFLLQVERHMGEIRRRELEEKGIAAMSDAEKDEYRRLVFLAVSG